MRYTRLLPLLAPLGLLAACGGEAPSDDERSASGEVLEGTISDAMLPVARVRSEPPLENPDAFAEAREEAGGPAPAAAGAAGETAEADAEADEGDEAPAAEAEAGTED